MQQMEDDADDLILKDEEADYFIPGALAGHYWLSGEPPVRARKDLLLVEGDWTLSAHGRDQDIAECVTTIHVFDVETTGLKPEEEARAIEIAAVLVCKSDRTVIVQEQGKRSFVNPHGPIPPQASGVHHIIDKDVEGAPYLDEALDRVLDPFGLDAVSICAAHNSKFDSAFLPMLNNRQWIDTLRCTQHVWPDAPDFKNQTLRYWLGIDLPRERMHRALEDATVTAHILARLLAERTVDELVELSRAPVLLRKVSFGKYHGQSWSDVPTDYLRWISSTVATNEALRASGLSVGPSRFDDDVIFTVRTELAKRSAAPRR
jgi:exodeoxyribonuclease X